MKLILVLISFIVLTGGNVLYSEENNLSHHYTIAKETCHDISAIRSQIDRINHDILKLLAERTAYVKRAGDLKFCTTKIADDRQRVADQEKTIIDRSIALELPIEISLPAFRAIVETSTQFQQGYIDRDCCE